jgi:small-conductance mechanosensitive channel
MLSEFLKSIYGNLLSTGVTLIVLILVYVITDLFFARKIESVRQKRRFRIRLIYIVSLIFLFLMARIWIEGYTHLLAILGLVSAALVVTNKETIMNFVGWLIIIWRGLFFEDDLIQIQQYRGYVKRLGIFYFTLSEVSDTSNEMTGRVIRIPNGLVANNPLINFSQASHFLRQQFSVVITQDSNIEKAIRILSELVTEIINLQYKHKVEFSIDHLKKHHRHSHEHVKMTTKVNIKPKLDKPTGVELSVRYYCPANDFEDIQQRIWLKLLALLREEKEIRLSYSN